MSRRRRHSEEHGKENHERWLLTYADMITLLMAFFIMMYSMSVLNLAKFNQVAFSIRSGFGGLLRGGEHLMSAPAGESAVVSPNPLRNMKTTAKPLGLKQGIKGSTLAKHRLMSYLITNNLQNKVEVVQDPRGLAISIISDGLLFQRGTAELVPGTGELLAHVAAVIKTVDNSVLVEGYTCDLPISSVRYPSNWELSSARACSVVRYFSESLKINPGRLTAVGYGETRPRLPNDSEHNRALNRRVLIVLLHALPQEDASGAETLSPRLRVETERVKPELHPIR